MFVRSFGAALFGAAVVFGGCGSQEQSAPAPKREPTIGGDHSKR